MSQICVTSFKNDPLLLSINVCYHQKFWYETYYLGIRSELFFTMHSCEPHVKLILGNFYTRYNGFILENFYTHTRGRVPHVQLSTNCRLDYLVAVENTLHELTDNFTLR